MKVPPLSDHRPAYTISCIAQSNAPEDGQNNCPKHVELMRIINKQLLLHLVGCHISMMHGQTNIKFLPYVGTQTAVCSVGADMFSEF
jgi:hypothetical protein